MRLALYQSRYIDLLELTRVSFFLLSRQALKIVFVQLESDYQYFFVQERSAIGMLVAIVNRQL